MNSPDLILNGYLPIMLGSFLIIFNRQITEAYEKFAERDGTAFPRFLTFGRLIIGGLFLIGVGLWKLLEVV